MRQILHAAPLGGHPRGRPTALGRRPPPDTARRYGRGGRGQPGYRQHRDHRAGHRGPSQDHRGPALRLPGHGQPRGRHRGGAARRSWRTTASPRPPWAARAPGHHGRRAGGRGPRPAGLAGPRRREADWIGLVNRVKPHTDFKGSIESGLFKMMTIGLGKYKGATQYHRANVTHGYETVITAVGREMLAKARIGFGLGIVENGYDETAKVEAFNAADLEAGERRLLKERAGVDGPAALLAHRRAGGRGDRQEHLGLGHGHQRDRPALQPARAVSRPIPRSSGSWRSISPRRATATPPASATPTSPRAGWSTRST